MKAVASLSDQAILTKLSMSDPSPRVRQAAVAKVTDQELLLKIALDSKEIDVRVAAVERIDSQEKLAEIIKVRRNFQLMGACFARITDKKVLDGIAKNPEYNMSARRMAIESYADESFLTEISGEQAGTNRIKTPEEINKLIKKYGGAYLVRALGRFRGSKNAILALGEIVRQGGEPAILALEKVTQGLAHANPQVSEAARAVLVDLDDPGLITRLIAMMDNEKLHDRILAVLREIDHPDARQIIDSAD